MTRETECRVFTKRDGILFVCVFCSFKQIRGGGGNYSTKEELNMRYKDIHSLSKMITTPTCRTYKRSGKNGLCVGFRVFFLRSVSSAVFLCGGAGRAAVARRRLQLGTDVLYNQINGYQVIGAARNYHISPLL